MSASMTVSTKEFLSSIEEELGQAFSVRPDYGTVGLVCHFHDGAVVRIEVTRSTLRKIREDKNAHPRYDVEPAKPKSLWG